MKYRPVPPIKNPITEQACLDLARQYLESTLPEPEKKKMISENFQAWLEKNPLVVRWEALAMQERIRSLIDTPECQD